jgi:membrane protease YdiL (CAAX protease family)
MWEIWHLPTKVGFGMTMLILHAIFIISLSLIITVYYNRSSKSIIPAILMHSSVNLTGYLFLVCIIDIM